MQTGEIRRFIYDTTLAFSSSVLKDGDVDTCFQKLSEILRPQERFKNIVAIKFLRYVTNFLLEYSTSTAFVTGGGTVDGTKNTNEKKKNLKENIFQALFSEQVLGTLRSLDKDIKTFLENNGSIQDEEKRLEVVKGVEVFLRAFITNWEVRAPLVDYANLLLTKFDNLASNPTVQNSIQRFDTIDLPTLFLELKNSPLTFLDKISHEMVIPFLHGFLERVELEPIQLELANNPLSKANLKLSNLIASIPKFPEKIHLRTVTETDFQTNEKILSSAKTTLVATLGVRDVPVELQGMSFDYAEDGLFVTLHKQGHFNTTIQGLDVLVSIALERQEDQVVLKPGGEQKIRLKGVSMQFHGDVSGADVLNRLAGTFKEQITAAIGEALEKKLVGAVVGLCTSLNVLVTMARQEGGVAIQQEGGVVIQKEGGGDGGDTGSVEPANLI